MTSLSRTSALLATIVAMASMASAPAQQRSAAIPPDLSFLTPEVNSQLETQAGDFYLAVSPSIATAADSTVWVRAGRRVLSLGTVVGDGREVLTKWSEVASRRDQLEVVSGTGKVRTAKISGVYLDYDLARIKITGEPLVPIGVDQAVVPPLGSFLVAARPDKVPVSVGVTGVMPRSLRESDRAFIGVRLDDKFQGNGARIDEITEDSPAQSAGLLKGDIILALGNEEIGGLFELQNRLLAFKPGDVAELQVERDGKQRQINVTLAQRSESPQFPRQRLDVMERMGGAISRVRSGFPQVLETDMFLKPNETGGPVVDLDGNFVGITLARASRVRSFIIPAADLAKLLLSDPIDPQLALASLPSADEGTTALAGFPVPPQDPMRNMPDPSELRRLMGLMDEELRRLDHDD